MSVWWSRIVNALVLFALPLTCSAQESSGKAGQVSVVTSFAKDVTDPVKKAFEAANPGFALDVQNRSINAGVTRRKT